VPDSVKAPYNPDYFPFNQPPSGACGDDFWDLRVHDSFGNDSGSTRFQTLTGRVSLKYKFDSGWMAYSSIAWGEKPGGLQLLEADVLTDTSTETITFSNKFDPEKITAYELGIKGFSADHRVSIDIAAFYNDWTDIVLRQLTDQAPNGATFVQPEALNVNAGDARVWGWETQVDMAITDNLTGGFTAAWTDSKLTNARQDTYSLFPSFYTQNPSCTPAAIQAITGANADDTAALQDQKAGQCQSISGNLSGNTQMRQPEWTSSAYVNYEHPLWAETKFYTNLNANYQSKIFVGNDNQSWLPAHTYVNMQLGLSAPRWEVQFWVRNLFNDDHAIAAFRDIYWANDDDIQGREAVPNSNFDDFPPLRLSVTYPTLRTYGLLARFRFGGAEK
jgi:iron complex outermembrane receptor protein